LDKAKDALGYSQITNLTAAVTLSGAGITIPRGAETLLLQAEAQIVRYRDDGTAPTAAIGMQLIVGTMYEFTISEIANMQFIQATASATLNISFYGTKV
jgi:hypothetical protein